MQIEAAVRSLISDAEAALVGQSDADPEELLSRARWMLRLDPDRKAVLRGDDLPNWAASQSTRIHRLRTRGRRPDPNDEYSVRCDLSLRDISDLRAERTTTVRDVEEAKQERVDDAMEEYDIPELLEPWAFMNKEKRERMQSVLVAAHDHPVSSYSDMERRSNASESPSRTTPATTNSVPAWRNGGVNTS